MACLCVTMLLIDGIDVPAMPMGIDIGTRKLW